jgi:hypothetical protein
MTESTSHLQPDGTTFPPLTPDPPPPPGYVDPIGELERLMERTGAAGWASGSEGHRDER